MPITGDRNNTKIEGATDGTEIANYGADLETADILNEGTGTQAELTVGTSAVELKVGGSPLTNRKLITIQPKDNSVYWGYSSGVTTTTGTRIFKDQLIALPVGSGQSIYLIANGASKAVSITEA